MKKITIIITITLGLLSFQSCQSQVKIGDNIWSSKNLDVDHFRNGDIIPECKTKEEWIKAIVNKQPAWCYYDNDPKNGKLYGRIYNWYAVTDPRELAPEGWHMPTGKEWYELAKKLDPGGGLKLRSKNGWKNNGNNETGFSALPGGYRDPYSNREFDYQGSLSAWFSCSSSGGQPLCFILRSDYLNCINYNMEPTTGAYVRCVKNK